MKHRRSTLVQKTRVLHLETERNDANPEDGHRRPGHGNGGAERPKRVDGGSDTGEEEGGDLQPSNAHRLCSIPLELNRGSAAAAAAAPSAASPSISLQRRNWSTPSRSDFESFVARECLCSGAMALAACRAAHSVAGASPSSLAAAAAKPSSSLARPQFAGLRRADVANESSFGAVLSQRLQVRVWWN